MRALVAALSIVAGCAGAASAPWNKLDLGPFLMSAPAGWTLRQGGTDSVTGHLGSEGLDLDYDFGLYSDPLAVPAGARDVSERAVQVDGLPARRVSYTLQRNASAPVYYLGVHVPQVRVISLGRIRLTLLAHSTAAKELAEVDAVVATIRFKPGPPSRRI
jgi:hypothetical protein